MRGYEEETIRLEVLLVASFIRYGMGWDGMGWYVGSILEVDDPWRLGGSEYVEPRGERVPT